MANNNVQNVRFLRNGSLYETHDAALTGLKSQSLSTEQDGSLILARYGSGNDVKTLAGLVYAKGDNKSITIIDIEGASADVEALRQEINAKLGNGVGSGASETVTAQLTALSGNSSTDTSATTSVEGAKKYAKDYTDEQIGELEYTGVTTGTGVYVTNVTETDGVVSATTATLPSLAEVHEAGKPIIAVAEDKGQLAASAGTINAEFVNVTGDTFTATTVQGALEEIDSEYKAAIENLDYTDTAVTKQFVAAVDESNGVVSITRGEIESSGKTIVLTADGNDVNFEVNIDGVTLEKDANGVISVTSSALVQYEGDDDTIQIGAVSDGKRIVSSPLTIQKVTTGLSEEVKEEYHLIGHSGTTIGDPVKIYKDSHIVSITYITKGEHAQNLEYKYIDASGNTQTTYVDMSELVLEAEFASGVTVTDHIAHGVVDGTSEGFLTVGADGFKLSGVQDAINTAVGTAVSGLDASVSAETTHITVKVDEVDGKLTAVTLTEDDIASAQGLANEITARTADTKSINDKLGTGVTAQNTATAQLAALSGTPGASSAETSVEGAKSYADAILADAVEGLDADVSGNSTHVTVGVEEVNGKITAVTVSESDIASASALTAEIAARKAVDGVNGDAYTADTSAHYISGASSLYGADQALDSALNTVDNSMLTGVTAGNGIEVTAKADKSQTISAKVKNDGGIVNDENGLHLGYIDAGEYSIE